MTEENERPIPSSWRDHFGEEAFGDIWVYVQYGDRTPLEALGILGLAPPEKRIEAKQEGSKPSEEKIRVTTPEISIKEDTTKEVMKMENQQKNEEEKTKRNFFPNTLKQEAERSGGDFFPSMKGIPETIEIPTETDSKGGKSGQASMPINQFPDFVLRRLETAFTWGDLSETLKYYISVGDGGEIFDRRTLGDLKGFVKDYDGAKSLDERKGVFEEISKYLRGMKIEKK